MEISLGFLVVLNLVLFPGLIFRRLYYYGEFSREYSTGLSLVKLLSLASVPGLILLVVSYMTYDLFFVECNLSKIIDALKDISNPDFRLQKSAFPANKILIDYLLPFIGFEYLLSILFGVTFGRLVRIAGIDTRFRLLKYKNEWFYLFNGHYHRFKKLKFRMDPSKKFLFTKADVLVEANGKSLLYSGIVVDYELKDDNCSELSKVYLRGAERYSRKEDKITKVKIPGELFVLNCQNLININLTYVYEQGKSILESKWPKAIEVVLSIIYIILIPIFVFESESIDWRLYSIVLEYPWYKKIVAYFLLTQLLVLVVPFYSVGSNYKWVSFKIVILKILYGLIFAGLLYLL